MLRPIGRVLRVGLRRQHRRTDQGDDGAELRIREACAAHTQGPPRGRQLACHLPDRPHAEERAVVADVRDGADVPQHTEVDADPGAAKDDARIGRLFAAGELAVKACDPRAVGQKLADPRVVAPGVVEQGEQQGRRHDEHHRVAPGSEAWREQRCNPSGGGRCVSMPSQASPWIERAGDTGRH
jgi:hypothetical protein